MEKFIIFYATSTHYDNVVVDAESFADWLYPFGYTITFIESVNSNTVFDSNSCVHG